MLETKEDSDDDQGDENEDDNFLMDGVTMIGILKEIVANHKQVQRSQLFLPVSLKRMFKAQCLQVEF